MRIRNIFLKGLLPILILVAGIAGMKTLIAHRTAPVKQERENPGALVETLTIGMTEKRADLRSSGVVQAGQEIMVALQVDGKVDRVSPNFVAGGFFRQGEVLFGVDALDYELAVERASAALIKAKTDLTVMESKARLGQREWERLHPEGDEKPNPLVVYEPQLASAQAGLAAAAASLRQAEADLSRTKVAAPFDCRVRSEQIGLGQYIRAGNPVATLVSVDVAEIVVALPLDELPWLQLAGEGDDSRGAPATVRLLVDGKVHEWQGRVNRSLREVDAKSRMAQVVVRVEDPYDISRQHAAGEIQLDVGMFVEVVIHGRDMRNIAVIPRKALRDGQTVWIMDDERKLRVRKVEPVRYEQDEVWISNGLAEGDRVVLTALSGGADGMRLRPAESVK